MPTEQETTMTPGVEPEVRQRFEQEVLSMRGSKQEDLTIAANGHYENPNLQEWFYWFRKGAKSGSAGTAGHYVECPVCNSREVFVRESAPSEEWQLDVIRDAITEMEQVFCSICAGEKGQHENLCPVARIKSALPPAPEKAR